MFRVCFTYVLGGFTVFFFYRFFAWFDLPNENYMISVLK